MLEKELQFYIEHQNELVEKYDGRVIILKDGKVLGDFETMVDAYFHAVDEGWLGKVMIHNVGPGEDNYTITLHSSMVFA